MKKLALIFVFLFSLTIVQAQTGFNGDFENSFNNWRFYENPALNGSCQLTLDASSGSHAVKLNFPFPNSNNVNRTYNFSGGTISQVVLNNYLSRSITQATFLCSNGFTSPEYLSTPDDERMLLNVGAKFIGRSIYTWGQEMFFNNPQWLSDAKAKINRMHQSDSDRVFQAAIFECVSNNVNSVPIPAWVFNAFGQTVVTRNFIMTNMQYSDGRYVGHWGPNTIVPDITKLETRMLFYFMAVQYMQAGIEAIHWGQVRLMDQVDTNYVGWIELLTKVRAVAKTIARRGTILCDSHCPNIFVNGKLLFDFASFPSRPAEVIGSPEVAKLQTNFLDNIYCKTVGGITPSGWSCTNSPYIVELDNFGISNHPGVANLSEIFVWGYDEISWFYLQPTAYKNLFLKQMVNFIASVDPVGFIQMPGLRNVTLPDGLVHGYRCNTQNVGCPTGQSQEQTIKEIWGNINSNICDFTISSQADVQLFAPGNDTINNLTITGPDITDALLRSMATKFKVVRGTVTIQNTSITSTEGFFDVINCLGGIVLIDNLSGGGVFNLNGLKTYTNIGGDMTINNCPGAAHWGPGNCLSQVKTVAGNLRIIGGQMANNALISLTDVGGDFEIRNNNFNVFWNLNGGVLKTIGGNLIYTDNNYVNGLGGLETITHIGANVTIGKNGASGGEIPLQSITGRLGFCLIKGWVINGAVSPSATIRLSLSTDEMININSLTPCP